MRNQPKSPNHQLRHLQTLTDQPDNEVMDSTPFTQNRRTNI